jgi:hypothetical protein
MTRSKTPTGICRLSKSSHARVFEIISIQRISNRSQIQTPSLCVKTKEIHRPKSILHPKARSIRSKCVKSQYISGQSRYSRLTPPASLIIVPQPYHCYPKLQYVVVGSHSELPGLDGSLSIELQDPQRSLQHLLHRSRVAFHFPSIQTCLSW